MEYFPIGDEVSEVTVDNARMIIVKPSGVSKSLAASREIISEETQEELQRVASPKDQQSSQPTSTEDNNDTIPETKSDALEKQSTDV